VLNETGLETPLIVTAVPVGILHTSDGERYFCWNRAFDPYVVAW